ncbi:MAG: serine hydrolase domain-containing protein [Myxococcota bacterium]
MVLLVACGVSAAVLFLAMGVGRASNDLMVAAPLALGAWGLLPPLLVGRLAIVPGSRTRVWPVVLRAAGPHVAIVAAAIGLQASGHRWPDALAFVFVDGSLMALAASGRSAVAFAVLLGVGPWTSTGSFAAAPDVADRDRVDGAHAADGANGDRCGLAFSSEPDFLKELQASEAVRPLLSAAQSRLRAYAFDPEAGYRTDGLLVVHRGRIVFEGYDHGYNETTPHLTWSISKTVTAALLGVAVNEGVVRLDDRIDDLVPFPVARSLRVLHLLEFSSGYDWTETYEGDESPQNSSVIAMLYGEGRGNMARFVASHPLRDPPGTSWSYSSGDTNLMMAAVQGAMSQVHGPSFPWSVLFEPLGMKHVVFERDGSGTYAAASSFYAPPRDMARFGHLFLEDGCFEGRRLLPNGWVRTSTQIVEAYLSNPIDLDPTYVSGRHWWLNRAAPAVSMPKPFPSAPDDAFAARGHWGQELWVIPSRQTVLVRFGEDRGAGNRIDRDRLLALALELAEVVP